MFFLSSSTTQCFHVDTGVIIQFKGINYIESFWKFEHKYQYINLNTDVLWTEWPYYIQVIST